MVRKKQSITEEKDNGKKREWDNEWMLSDREKVRHKKKEKSREKLWNNKVRANEKKGRMWNKKWELKWWMMIVKEWYKIEQKREREIKLNVK